MKYWWWLNPWLSSSLIRLFDMILLKLVTYLCTVSHKTTNIFRSHSSYKSMNYYWMINDHIFSILIFVPSYRIHLSTLPSGRTILLILPQLLIRSYYFLSLPILPQYPSDAHNGFIKMTISFSHCSTLVQIFWKWSSLTNVDK